MKRNREGFSILELMLALGIGSLVLFASYRFLRSASETSLKLSENTQEMGADMTANHSIWRDLKATGHSFGLLSLMDNKQKSFYDYLPDYTCQETGSQSCERTLTISSKQRSMVLVLDKPGIVKAVPFSPGAFYLAEAVPAAAATLTDLTANLIYDASKLVSFLKTTPGLFAENQILRFYTPTYLRSDATVTNLSAPAQMPSLIVRVQANQFTKLNFEGLTSQKHPITEIEYTGVDQFLRTLPAVGGTNTFALISAIKIVKYSVESISSNQLGLIRYEYDGTNFVGRTVVSSPIECIKFKRKNISSKSISFSIFTSRSTECDS